MLFAIGFTDIAMLGWLAATAAPIIVHLWNRRSRREVDWAAMSFLRAAMQSSARRVRLQNWLLLVIRASILMFAALAVAGPYLQNLTGSGAAGTPTHKLVVIDDSYSMGYGLPGKTRFDRAKQLAVQLIEQSEPGDRFTLIPMAMSAQSRSAQSIAAQPNQPASETSPERVVDAVGVLQPQASAANLSRTLATLESALTDSQNSGAPPWPTQVYFLTDLAANTWDSLTDEQAKRLSDAAEVFVLDLGEQGANNVAIQSFRAEPLPWIVGRPGKFHAEATQFGDEAASTAVRWRIDGRLVSEESFELGAGEQRLLSHSWEFDEPGIHIAEVEVARDKLTIDDRRWFVIDVRPRVRVLIVNGDGTSDAVRPLAAAIDPNPVEAHSPYQVKTITDGALVDTDLQDYDVVILSNVAQFTPSEAEMLSRFVKRGGGLMVFLGDRVQAQRYNQAIGPMSGDSVILPATIESPADYSEYTLDPHGYRHPIVAEFRSSPGAGLLSTPIGRYWRLREQSDKATGHTATGHNVLAIRETGDPVVVESSVGLGRVVLFAIPASLASVDEATGEPWTLMPAWHSFLPLVQESLRFALGDGDRRYNVAIGDPMIGYAAPGDAVQVEVPADGNEKRNTTVLADASGQWRFAETNTPGVYRFSVGMGQTAKSFAVNIATGGPGGESSLAKLADAKFPTEFTRIDAVDASGEINPIGLGPRTALERWFLYAALLMLLVDTALSCWLGRRSG